MTLTFKPAMRAVGLGIALATTLALSPLAAMAEVHKVVFHIDDNDPQRMNIVLNNIGNVYSYYEEQGDEVEIQVVAHGPGLHMLRADTSPVAPRIASMSLEHENLTFNACGNTIRGMERQSGAPVTLLSEAQIVPAGVIHLVTLQEQGWAYIRP